VINGSAAMWGALTHALWPRPAEFKPAVPGGPGCVS
jgi:hypothetical protein